MGTTTVASGATLGLGVSGAGCFGSADVDALFAGTFPRVSMNSSARVGIDTTGGSFTYFSSVSGSKGLTKLGTNTLILAVANTYSGVTTINAGSLLLNHATALPGGIGVSGGTSALTFNGGVLGLGVGDFTRGLAVAGTATAANFTGSGGWAAYNAARAVNLGGNATPSTIAWGTANTGFNGKTLILGADSATHTVDLQNPLDLGNGSRSIQVDDGAAAIDAQLSGVLSGVSGGNFTKNGLGTLALTAANTYVGTTTVQGGGTLMVTGTGSIGSTGTNALTVGGSAGTPGTLQYSSSATSCFANATIGVSTGNGTLNQTAGFISVTGSVNMATGDPGSGTINLSGGTLAVGTALNVAQRGPLPGTVNLSGTGILTAGSLVVADFSAGRFCTGQFTQSGGTATVGSLVLAKTATDAYTRAGTYDFNGGTLNAGSVAGGIANAVGGTNTSVFNFNGGTLKPTANNAAFMQGLTSANVKDGGAVIDTATFDITIAQPLLHAVAATTDALTKNGAGTLTLTGTNTYSGATTVNAGTLALGGAGQLGGGVYAAAIVNNGALIFGSSANQTCSGGVSGNGTLTKAGAGTLTLTGATPYSGATAVTAGKLAVVTGGALGNSDVTVSSGAKLGVRVLTGGGQWSCKSLTLGAGTTTLELNSYVAAPSASTAPVQVNGNLVNNGTLNVTLAGVGYAVGSYPLIRYTGALTVGTLGTVTLPNGGAGTLVNNAGNSTIDVTVSTASTPLVWNGGSGNWDINATANWAGGLTYLEGNAVLFDDTSSGTPPFTVTLPASVNPANVTVNNPTKDYAFAGPGVLSGEADLIKRGAGTLTLTNSNTYSGGTTLDASSGTVKATVSTTQFGIGTGPVAIGAGATLQVDNTNVSSTPVSKANAVAGSGVLKLNFATNTTARSTALPGVSGFAGTVQLASVSSTGDKWDAGEVNAPGAAVLIESGNTLLLGSAAASFGSLSVRGTGNSEGRGAIRLGAAAAALTGAIALQGDATIASDAAGATLRGTITGTAAAGATNVLTQGTSASAAGCILSGAIGDGANGGKVALTQTKGTLTLSATNTYSGLTTVNGGGTLQLGATDVLPVTGNVILGSANSVGNLTLGAFSQTLASLTALSSSASVNTVVVGPGQTLTVSGPAGLFIGTDLGTTSTTQVKISGGGALVVTNASAYVTVGRSQTNESFYNTCSLDLSDLSTVVLGSSLIPLNEIRLTYGAACPATLTLSNSTNLLTATTLNVGHSNNANSGPGTLIFGAGLNTLAVNTLNIAQSKGSGTIKFASQVPGSAGSVTIGGRTRATTDLSIGNKIATQTGSNPSGTLDLRGHAATVSAGTVTLGKEDNMGTYNGVTGTNFVSSTIGALYFDAGTFTVTNLNMAAKSGYSLGSAIATLTVSGGVFTVAAGGTFTLASQVGWGNATGTLNVVGGTFRSNADIRGGASNCITTVRLNGGTLDMTGHAIGLGFQTVSVFNAQSGTLMNLSQFNNGMPLVKAGNGTLTLSGTNTYSGATVVSNGTLRLTGAACLPPTADFYLISGATAQLDYAGALPVHTLYIDGVRKLGSLYGQNNLSSFLSGSGYLRLPQQATLLLMK